MAVYNIGDRSNDNASLCQEGALSPSARSNFLWRYLGFSLLVAISVSAFLAPLGSVTSYRDGLGR